MNLMMFIPCSFLLVFTVIVLPLGLTNGQIHIQPCDSVRVEVETLAGDYQSINSNTMIYRPLNSSNLIMRCQCIGGNDTLRWSYPTIISPYICTDQSDICIRNYGQWKHLTIPLVKKIHDGIYFCAGHQDPYLQRPTFHLVVFDVPVIKQPQRNISMPLKENSNVTLQCRAAGYGSLKYYWERNDSGNWITVDNNNRTSYTTGNTGQYRCNVTNEVGSVVSPVITVYAIKPVIATHPVNATVRALTNITFTCLASDANFVTFNYSWHRNNGDIPSTRSRGQNTNTLTITRAIPSDEGMYYCIATNDGGSTSSRSASLTVDDELSITVSPLSQTVSEGGVATFTATASGIKTREFGYEWLKIVKGGGFITVGRNMQLTINNIRIEDQGDYYCKVENEWGKMNQSETVQLIVNVTSSAFTTHPQDQFIHDNEDAVFECAANGSESLNITWIKNDVHISDSHLTEVSHSEKKSVLKIDKATVENSGIYQCIATNADNELVLSKPAELLVLPSMNTHSDNVTVLTGQSVNLTCSATGTDVVYQWMRNGVIISDDNSNVLTINEVKQSDDGIYQCIASNKGGNATSNPTMIKVYDKPVLTQFPPQMLGVLGEQFQITCNATNDKDAPHNMMFTWMTPDGVDPNVKMTSEDDDHTASSTLYISRLARSDNGTYKCYVTNNNASSASVVTSTTVIVEERPSQPVNFNVFNYDPTSLLLIWSDPSSDNREITYYTVFWSDGETKRSINVFNFNGSYILKNLSPSTQYILYVTAVRLIGVNKKIVEGNSSITVTATTSAEETQDNNCTCSMLMVQVFMILLAASLVVCLGLIVLALGLYKKNVQLRNKLKSVDKKVSTGKAIKSSDDVFRSSDEKLTAPNPIYASAITTGSKSTGRDIAVNNPMYQSAPSGNKRMLSYHEYESIHIDNLIAKHSAS